MEEIPTASPPHINSLSKSRSSMTLASTTSEPRQSQFNKQIIPDFYSGRPAVPYLARQSISDFHQEIIPPTQPTYFPNEHRPGSHCSISTTGALTFLLSMLCTPTKCTERKHNELRRFSIGFPLQGWSMLFVFLSPDIPSPAF